MTPRPGTVSELQRGMYVRSSNGTMWRVDHRAPLQVQLSTPDGKTAVMDIGWDDQTPVTILEPTEADALEVLQDKLGAEIIASRDHPSKPFRVVPMGNQLAKWHHHMLLLHGIHTATGPGSRSLSGILAAHTQDHEDADNGRPTGRGYVNHTH